MPTPGIDQLLASAAAHHSAGRLAEAEAGYRQVLKLQPDNTNALHLLGLIAHQTNHNRHAVQLIARAIAIDPGIANFHNTLAEAHRALGQFDAAFAEYQAALALDPNLLDALLNLSILFRHLRQPDQAIAAPRRTVEAHPDHAEARVRLGEVLLDYDLERSLAAFARALEIEPDLPAAH